MHEQRGKNTDATTELRTAHAAHQNIHEAAHEHPNLLASPHRSVKAISRLILPSASAIIRLPPSLCHHADLVLFRFVAMVESHLITLAGHGENLEAGRGRLNLGQSLVA